MSIDISKLQKIPRVSFQFLQNGTSREFVLKPLTQRTVTFLNQKYFLGTFDPVLMSLQPHEIANMIMTEKNAKVRERLGGLLGFANVWSGQDLKGLCELCFYLLTEDSKKTLFAAEVAPWIDENGKAVEISINGPERLYHLFADDEDYAQSLKNRIEMQKSVYLVVNGKDRIEGATDEDKKKLPQERQTDLFKSLFRMFKRST